MGEAHVSGYTALIIFRVCGDKRKWRKKGNFPNQHSINHVDTPKKMKMVGFVHVKVTFQKEGLENQWHWVPVAKFIVDFYLELFFSALFSISYLVA